MSYPLTRAQRQFQKIKKAEKSQAKLRAEGKMTHSERRDTFLKCRRQIEERIAEQLILRGLEINHNAVRHLAFDLAKKEMQQ